MKRLLCLVSNMNAGGAETFLMKIYRNIDRNMYQMDFCVNVIDKCFYEDEIKNMGGILYRIPSRTSNYKEHNKQLKSIIEENNYNYILVVSSSSTSFLDLKVAKKAGAKVRAIRSSNSQGAKGVRKIIHFTGKLLFSKYATIMLAPSDLAAEYLFGKKAIKNGQVEFLHNAVDLDYFKFDYSSRGRIRDNYEIDDNTLLIGHIGRFYKQKNHMFLIDVFYEIQKQKPDSVLFLVGSGDLECVIKEKVKTLNIEDKVLFLGTRSDIPALLSAMDVFVFPSFYEGMPNTVIEAQATGLPCIISDTITKEANITDKTKFLSLDSSATYWARKVLDCNISKIDRNTHNAFFEQRYDIDSCTDQFVRSIFKS